jgi:hypothetical protein
MKHLAVAIALLVAACGSKEDEKKKAPTDDKKVDEKKPPTDDKKVEPPAAPVDPATFVDLDLSPVARLAGHTVKAPPGATLAADQPPFGEDKPAGGVISKDGFALHLWWSTTGGERTVLPMRADMEGLGAYVETACNPDLCEYTLEKDGAKKHGFFRPVDRRDDADLSASDAQLLCGPAKELASAEALAPYKAACDTVKRK